jgi:hypothetical protein
MEGSGEETGCFFERLKSKYPKRKRKKRPAPKRDIF